MTKLSDMDDGALIRASIADSAAFRELFVRHHDRVRTYVVSRLGPSFADDCVADTFLEAFRIRSRFEDARGNDALPWLLGIATNAIARQRAAEQRWIRQRVEQPFDLDAESLDRDGAISRIDAGRMARDLAAAIGEMPDHERDAFLLVVLGELSYEDVAVALDIPIGTVRSRVSRGRARVGQAMAVRSAT